MIVSYQLKIIQEKPLVAKLLCLLFLVLTVFSLLNTVADFKFIYKDSANSTPSINFVDNNSLKILIKRGLSVEIFGKYIPKKIDDINIRASLLDLQVIGIMFSKNKNNSQVLLRVSDGIERTFKVGDIIPGGAMILHIFKDAIVVKRDGVLERLNLPKRELLFVKPQRNL